VVIPVPAGHLESSVWPLRESLAKLGEGTVGERGHTGVGEGMGAFRGWGGGFEFLARRDARVWAIACMKGCRSKTKLETAMDLKGYNYNKKEQGKL